MIKKKMQSLQQCLKKYIELLIHQLLAPARELCHLDPVAGAEVLHDASSSPQNACTKVQRDACAYEKINKYLSIHLSIYPSIYLPIYLSIYLSI